MLNLATNKYGLSGNALKILAAVTMLIDHIGMMLFPAATILRIIGRLSFPIFSFMIAEGCAHTKNKLRYFLSVFALGAICQLVLYLQRGNAKMCVLITFSVSIIVVYILQLLKSALFAPKKSFIKCSLTVCLFMLTVLGVYFLNRLISIDYGFWGCMAPAFASVFKKPASATSPVWSKLDNNLFHTAMFGICLTALSINYGKIQPYCLLALPFLMLYSGRRGILKMKYFFYIFYPLHLALLEGISYLF